MTRFLLAAAFAFAANIATAATAKSFTGYVEWVVNNGAPSPVAEGTPIKATYLYDDVANTFSSSVQFGDILDVSADPHEIVVTNLLTGTRVPYQTLLALPDSLGAAGYPPCEFCPRPDNNAALWFGTLSLTPSPYLQFSQGGNLSQYTLIASLNEIPPVPEPSSASLLALGLIAIFRLHRRD